MNGNQQVGHFLMHLYAISIEPLSLIMNLL